MAKNSRVVLFALVKNSKVLVEKRSIKGYTKPQYLIPGGAINDHEAEGLESALKREMMEELGIVPIEFKLLTEEDIPGLHNNILKPFIVTSWQGEIPQFILDKEDHNPLEWIEIKLALNQFPIKPTKKIIEVIKEHFPNL